MSAARRKNARRVKHGRQQRISFERPSSSGPVREVSDVQRALDRARDARDRILTPAQRQGLEEERKRFSDELDRLRVRTTDRQRKLDEKWRKDSAKVTSAFVDARRELEREHDRRRNTILELASTKAA